MQFNFLGNALSKGPIHGFLVGLSLVLLVVAVCIWIMELSGHTVSRHGFVKNGLRWNARTIAVIAVCAAIYIALRPLQVQFVPGIGGFNPSLSLGPVLSILFGIPGAIGVTFSMPIGDAISGALTIGSVAGCLGHTFWTWVPYKMVRKLPLDSVSTWVRLYIGILIGGVLHMITVCGWLDFTNALPPTVIWSAVTAAIALNHLIIPAVVVPILLTALFPLVRKSGMFHGDLEGGSTGRGDRPSMRETDAARVADGRSTTI